jgi:hypothetical protein
MALSFQHWQDRWSEGYTVYSGKIPIGSISSATFHAGSFAKGWQWAINNVALLGIANTTGRAERLDDAKRDLEYAWSIWVSAANLRQASNGAPD